MRPGPADPRDPPARAGDGGVRWPRTAVRGRPESRGSEGGAAPPRQPRCSTLRVCWLADLRPRPPQSAPAHRTEPACAARRPASGRGGSASNWTKSAERWCKEHGPLWAALRKAGLEVHVHAPCLTTIWPCCAGGAASWPRRGLPLRSAAGSTRWRKAAAPTSTGSARMSPPGLSHPRVPRFAGPVFHATGCASPFSPLWLQVTLLVIACQSRSCM